MVFMHGNNLVIYYRYITSIHSQNRVIVLDKDFNVLVLHSYCGKSIRREVQNLIGRLNECGRIIQEK